MNTRRQLLQQGALGLGAAALSSCEPTLSYLSREMGQGVPEKLAVPSDEIIDPDFHLLSRAAFGPWPGDLEQVRSMGRAAWIESQLHPASINDRLCDLRAERFESLWMSAADAYEFKKPILRAELTRHALLRAIYSRRQLFEVMVEFWSDHLNIDLEKGDCVYLKPSDDRDVIRKHALGRFKDLIRASATSPAMLVYLDGRTNKVRRGTQDAPNENYARELLELHTLGVHGGYTQSDVRDAARCLSGWTFDAKRKFVMHRDRAYFRTDWHDDGAKTVLGREIPAHGGEKDLDDLIEVICRHPSTATFIATKLCKRFIAPEPSADAVKLVASEFTRTDGDIAAVMRVLLNSEAFMASRGTLLKRPFRFMASALRGLAADTHVRAVGVLNHRVGALDDYLTRLGHGLFQYPTPDGYPDDEAPWMGTLMWRWNFALSLAAGEVSGVKLALPELEQALTPRPPQWWAHLIGRTPSDLERSALDADAKSEFIGMILASPAFQRC
jgi:uncharacterized protein (DUF1800 family)